MGQLLSDLIRLLDVELIEENIFRGQSQDLGFRQLFGGQVLAQALSAASQTVPDDRLVHSLHGYFLRLGDPSLPIIYLVDRVRDGGTFSARNVTAVQKGHTIFFCSASFHQSEKGFEHQVTMPKDIPQPEDLKNESELIAGQLDKLPPRIADCVKMGRPIEIRPVSVFNPFAPTIEKPIRHLWFKADGVIPDIAVMHKYVLLYTTDFSLLTTCLLPHGKGFLDPQIKAASIDHSIWFHGQPDMNDWMLYTIDSPWAGDARGFAKGTIFNRQGKLIASVCQEGLIRYLNIQQ